MGMSMENGLKGWWTISEEVKSREALGEKGKKALAIMPWDVWKGKHDWENLGFVPATV